jgi:hypothetical protein
MNRTPRLTNRQVSQNLAPGSFALALIAASPAAANTITFAQYFESPTTQQWTVSNNNNTISITASGNDILEFLNTGTSFGGESFAAAFTLNASSATAGSCGSLCGPNDTLDRVRVQRLFFLPFHGIRSGHVRNPSEQ